MGPCWLHLGFHPEGFNLVGMHVQQGQRGYPLRPEHVESLFWAHRTTKADATVVERLRAAGCVSSEHFMQMLNRSDVVIVAYNPQHYDQNLDWWRYDLEQYLPVLSQWVQEAPTRRLAMVREPPAQAAGAGDAGPVKLVADEETDLALTLLGFADALQDAYARRLPHLLCDHAFALAQAFSKFYAACRIVDESDASMRASRLTLAQTAGGQLDLILSLLGFSAPDRM